MPPCSLDNAASLPTMVRLRSVIESRCAWSVTTKLTCPSRSLSIEQQRLAPPKDRRDHSVGDLSANLRPLPGRIAVIIPPRSTTTYTAGSSCSARGTSISLSLASADFNSSSGNQGAFRLRMHQADSPIYLVFALFHSTIFASKSSVAIRSALDFPM